MLTSDPFQEEMVLFAAHEGSIKDSSGEDIRGTVFDTDSCLPIAFSHAIDISGCGLHAMWDGLLDAETFFAALGYGNGYIWDLSEKKYCGGLFIYEVVYDVRTVLADNSSWEHLRGGKLRRPKPNEILPLIEGKCPWLAGELL